MHCRPSTLHLTSHLMILRRTLTRSQLLCVCTSSSQRQTPSVGVQMSILDEAPMKSARYHHSWHTWLSKALVRGRCSSSETAVLYSASEWCKRCSGRCRRQGYIARVTRHSYRIGAATTYTAKARGIDDSTIKELGRWKSKAFEAYIKLPAGILHAGRHN